MRTKQELVAWLHNPHPLIRVIGMCFRGLEEASPEEARRMVQDACRDAVEFYEREKGGDDSDSGHGFTK